MEGWDLMKKFLKRLFHLYNVKCEYAGRCYHPICTHYRAHRVQRLSYHGKKWCDKIKVICPFTSERAVSCADCD